MTDAEKETKLVQLFAEQANSHFDPGLNEGLLARLVYLILLEVFEENSSSLLAVAIRAGKKISQLYSLSRSGEALHLPRLGVAGDFKTGAGRW